MVYQNESLSSNKGTMSEDSSAITTVFRARMHYKRRYTTVPAVDIGKGGKDASTEDLPEDS
jgi:hypothetical protein